MADFTCPLFRSAQSFPNALAVVDGPTTWSFTALETLVTTQTLQFHQQFPALGSRPARVALLGANSVAYLAALFALRRVGITPIPLNTRLTPRDWDAQIEAAQAFAVIGEETLTAALAPRPELQVVPLRPAKPSQLEAPPERATAPRYRSNQEAVLIFTSGSTGLGKGVRLSVEGCQVSACDSNVITELAPGDRWLLSMPLYHMSGLGIAQRCFEAGATIVLTESVSAEAILASVSHAKITHLSLVPTMLNDLLGLAEADQRSEALRSLKAIILAGAPSSDTLLERIRRAKIPVLSAYGMTETNAHCTCLPKSLSPALVHTVGRIFGSMRLEIRDSNDQPVPTGQLGEVVFSGPTVMLGYLDSEQTNRVLRNGWLHSGDLGRLDEQGLLTLHGRVDRMFISGGENIYPEEIENAASDFPGVRSCAVATVQHPRWGERPVLFVEWREKIDDPDGLETQLKEFLRSKIAKMKVPDRVVIIEELPKTAIGKIDYATLRKQAESL